nr:response regulator [Paenibacillus larvae]
MAPPIQVLVVDDSLFMRKIISDLIMESSQFQVVDSAKNGKEAIEKIVQLKPDVVTLDIEMPIMNGLQALEKIMKQCPTPVVMLSSLTEEGASETIRALELGAVDFIRKPSGSISLDLYKVQKQLHEKLHIAAQSKAGIARTALQTSGAEIKKPNEPVRPGTLKRIKSVSALLGKNKCRQNLKTGNPLCGPSCSNWNINRRPQSAANSTSGNPGGVSRSYLHCSAHAAKIHTIFGQKTE